MKRVSLALSVAVAALFFFPTKAGRLHREPSLSPLDARDSLNDWADLAQIHAAAGREEACSWCHLERRPGAARAIASDPRRWLASAKPASFATAGVGSEVCMSCHDGSLASAGTARLRETLSARGSSVDTSADHPVGMEYRAAVSRSPSEYNDPAFHADVRLDGGKVGCVSCHLGHGRNGRLGGPFGISERVCTTCHIR